MAVVSMAILLIVSLVVMLHYSRKALKEEAIQKAAHTLEATVQHIDNILLSVEQGSGNFYFSMMPRLSNPEKMYTICRKLVESSPYVTGCAIAFDKDFYKERQYFMAYVHRTNINGLSTIVQADTFGNCHYSEQFWFTEPMKTGRAKWVNPLTGMNADVEPLITFCLPIYGIDRKPVGVMGVDVSLNLLSQIIATAKPSPNSFCVLLDEEGEFIVYPDKNLVSPAMKSKLDENPTLKEVVRDMVAGKSGYRPFNIGHMDFHAFYKPFKRSAVPGRTAESHAWSAAIIYPDADIFGDYNRLFYYVIFIAIAGLLLMFVLCRYILHRQLTPLLMLTESAQHIAKGNYTESIPRSRQEDEIGQLQDNFIRMQHALAKHVGELEQLKTSLQESGKELQAAYRQSQKADRMKTVFLHNMTNQMIKPSEAIFKDVECLCDYAHQEVQKTHELAENIQKNGNAIADLLDNLIHISDEEPGKGGTQ